MFVQRTRNEFLAGARLARNEHRHTRAGQPADGPEHLLHRGRLADQRGDVLLVLAGILGLVGAAARGPAHELHGLVDIERFRQVLESTAFVGRHCILEVRVGRDHDHRQIRPAAVDLLEQGDAAHSRHAHVRNENVR